MGCNKACGPNRHMASIDYFLQIDHAIITHLSKQNTGVVAVPHISTVVDHADVNTTVTSVWKTIIARRMQQTVVGCSSTLRLTWKCPQRAFAGTSVRIVDLGGVSICI